VSLTLLGRINEPFGTGTGQREETVVRWAPNGQQLLVVETAAQPSVYVVGIDGRQVVDPVHGTFARWISDDSFFLQDDSGKWHLVSTIDGLNRDLPLPDTAFRPDVGPGADLIAFDNGNAERPSVSVLAVDTGTIHRLARGYLAPVWLGPDVLAASKVEPCPSGNFCPIPWIASGGTVGVDPATGAKEALSLPGTLQQGYRLEVIDVWLPPG
jgi:hypothetical protein